MTGVPSVSFSPPGLAMSYKKYNFLGGSKYSRSDQHKVNIISQDDIHHESFAVVSEYDWYAYINNIVVTC